MLIWLCALCPGTQIINLVFCGDRCWLLEGAINIIWWILLGEKHLPGSILRGPCWGSGQWQCTNCFIVLQASVPLFAGKVALLVFNHLFSPFLVFKLRHYEVKFKWDEIDSKIYRQNFLHSSFVSIIHPQTWVILGLINDCQYKTKHVGSV